MSQVIVLPPNGRRQTIKVTPNTTILEIIEQSCTKAGFTPGDYDLKHHRSILDPTSTVRYSGLPQNAQLELVETKRQRIESAVTICLQLESGKRMQGECQPTDTLWECFEKIAPQEASTISNPVLIFMRREVKGKEELMNTTLRSLGLTSGRAILRVLDRTMEQLRSQANVSAPLSKPTSKTDDIHPNLPSSSKEITKSKVDHTVAPAEVEKIPARPVNFPSETSIPPVQYSERSEKDSVQPPKMNTNENGNAQGLKSSLLNLVGGKRARLESPIEEKQVVEKVTLLGKRDAVAFNLDTAPLTPVDDLPDDFYELTIADIRHLAKESNRRLQELENAPLQTSEQRRLEKDLSMLRMINKHKSCVIRIRFPDRTVLQGCFTPLEKISNVYEFVKEYLDDPKLQFYLYVTPPKKILNPEEHLMEVGCVPTAVIYLGLKQSNIPNTYLKKDVMEKLSSLVAATQQGMQHLRETTREVQVLEESPPPRSDSITNPVAGPSHKDVPTAQQSAAVTKGPRTDKKDVPKWFKI